ncbi:MAG: hypothetical protein ACI9SG_001913 [Maribacter sp.]|jgi:hypothetical protein
MVVFVKLVLAHLIGDFMLQPLRWVVHKEANKIRSKYLYLHIFIHFALYAFVLWDLSLWKIAIILALSHLLIDLAKLYTNPWFKNKSIPFLLNQFLHVIILYVCSCYTTLPEHSISLFENLNWPLVLAVVFVTFPSAIIMGILLEPMSGQINKDYKSLPNAGKYIGIIERLFVLAFILIGRWDAIGLLITAKSVFRFKDLKESNSTKLTEYILIGTLVSFGLAILAGLWYLNHIEAIG